VPAVWFSRTGGGVKKLNIKTQDQKRQIAALRPFVAQKVQSDPPDRRRRVR